MTTNAKRAHWANCCIRLYDIMSRAGRGEDAIVDLLANLGHHAQTLKFDYLKLVATAIGHWHVEQTDPESIDTLPLVTITINESKSQ